VGGWGRQGERGVKHTQEQEQFKGIGQGNGRG